MNQKHVKSGIVLQCDASDAILRVIRDDRGITVDCRLASTLFGIVDPHSREKAEAFLRAAIEGRAAFGWELNVHCGGQLTGLLLTGGVTDQGVIVCGVPSAAGANELFDEMMKIQNEQVNVLRAALKREQMESARHRRGEQATLDEFTRLNNELVNTQRELARRNAELADANAQLESRATTDGLTGVKNRRAFQEALDREYDCAARRRSPLSLVMVDVDQFKQFNDRFGHPAGDATLKQVAAILAGESRSDTVVARYGGEEFAVILPHCEREEAAGVAERLRRAVEAGPWELRPVTVSLGVATTVDGAHDQARLIALADAAMYRAKIGGRNRVCASSDVGDLAPILAS